MTPPHPTPAALDPDLLRRIRTAEALHPRFAGFTPWYAQHLRPALARLQGSYWRRRILSLLLFVGGLVGAYALYTGSEGLRARLAGIEGWGGWLAFILGVLGAVLLVAAFAFAPMAGVKRRQAALAAGRISEFLGLAHDAKGHGSPSLRPLWAAGLLPDSHGLRIAHSVRGEHAGVAFTSASVALTRHQQRPRSTTHRTSIPFDGLVVQVALPAAMSERPVPELPGLTAVREAGAGAIAEELWWGTTGSVELTRFETGDVDFDGRFETRSSDPAAGARVLGADLRRALTALGECEGLQSLQVKGLRVALVGRSATLAFSTPSRYLGSDAEATVVASPLDPVHVERMLAQLAVVLSAVETLAKA
ncbi:MAG: hypothetical protein PVG07_03545 [Acidobacteriota bacterium]